MTKYDDTFFNYVSRSAIRSAQEFLPLVSHALKPCSVLDVGCGRGAWLSVWKKLGVENVRGIDGDYVQTSNLLIPEESFLALDLAKPFELAERFDLVQSLEVAEHLPMQSANTFIESLIRHSDRVLFSAAPKGQGGDHHVNEQSYDYWRKIFAKHDYVPVDFIRPLVKFNRAIDPWYRYNSFLYVSKNKLSDLPRDVSRFLITNERIEDISPLPYKLRKLVFSCLPVPAMTKLAKIKERILVNMARSK